ncbi:DUF2550 domain-containing protein [Populibacterium corticicola]|uniref:DUF2550 domain-containing protein n=1 Tax=Populibacterium corticicola TaxID=1812826 RepID=A0ABW5XBE3_9MICO
MGETVWVIIAVLVVLAVISTWGFLRLRRLTTSVGMFDCALRTPKSDGKPTDNWVQGLCEYQSDRLLWWRVYSLSVNANHIWMRDQFEVTGRVPLDQANLPDVYLVQCRHEGVPFELMMSAEAYHGLSSWVESAPPSAGGYNNY